MIMGFIGSVLSGSKIQSAVVGGLVAPLTIIHPLLAAGWFSGLVEAKYRKVRKRVLKYLRGEEIEADVLNGYGVLMVNGYPLGGYKAVNGKLKNHYPKGLRNVC